jgi:hypothetical protein
LSDLAFSERTSSRLRRTFIAIIGGAVASPLAARAQQPSFAAGRIFQQRFG